MTSISDEVDRLAAQRDAGKLSDAEFESAKARLFSQPGMATPHADYSYADPNRATLNNLRRTMSDKWIGGVCGGLAKLAGVESWIMRLLFVLAVLSGGVGIVVYLLLWIFIPPDDLR
jgi:phage shock protein C